MLLQEAHPPEQTNTKNESQQRGREGGPSPTMSFMGRCFMRALPVMTMLRRASSTTVAIPDRNRALVPEFPRYSSCQPGPKQV